MKLDEILRSPLTSWVNAERYVNDGSPSTYDTINTVTKTMHPLHGEATIEIPCFDFSNFIHWIGDNTFDSNTKGCKLKECLIPVHPDIVDSSTMADWLARKRPVSIITAIPSSSSRTVFVLDNNEPKYFFKLHYDRLLGRFNRSLNERRIKAALEVNADLVSIISDVPSGFSFLPEFAGIIVKDEDKVPSSFGAILRGLQPVGKKNDDHAIIPLFSLFSRDTRNPKDPPLLCELFPYDHPLTVFLEELIDIILNSYFFLAVRHGLIPEWNAQNLLISINKDGQIVGIVCRDLQGTYRDLAFRSTKLPNIDQGSYKVLECNNKYQCISAQLQRSYLFDFKLGEYVLTPLLRTAALCFGVKKGDVKILIKDRVKHIINNLGVQKNYFPDNNIWVAQKKGVRVKGPDFFDFFYNPQFR